MDQKRNKKIPKGTIVRLMNNYPYKILEDTTFNGVPLMVRVDEDFNKDPAYTEKHYKLFLHRNNPEQSILYQPISLKELKEYKKRNRFTRFEIMEI